MAGALTGERLAQRTQRTIDSLWRFLRRPSVAIVLAVLLLALLSTARIVTQIPGQAVEDPASTARWLNAERDAWGAWGGILRTLGLFNVTGSLLFFALLALLGLVCAVHLATLITAARLPRQLADALDAPVGVIPLSLATTDRIERIRVALSQRPDEAVNTLRQRLASFVGPVEERTIPEEGAIPGAQEHRMLASAGMRWLWLRTLLPAGALLALAVLWFTAVFGWNVRPPALAPGETFAAQPHGVTVTYTVPSGGAAALQVDIGGENASLAPGARSARVRGASVRVEAGAPAVYLRADHPLLALPGAPESRSDVGLVFSQPGSEQIVLLPESGAGVRIVRLPTEPAGAYLVEVYARDGVQPVQRVEVREAQTLTLPLETGAVSLWIEPMAGLNVTVRRTPGAWLFWLALALMVAGLAGLRRQPVFALAQLQPWPVDRTALTLQTNHTDLVAAFANPAPASPE